MKQKHKDKIYDAILFFAVVGLAWCLLGIYQYNRYDEENYNCRHMSIDCKDFFSNLGLNSQYMCGYNPPKKEGHRWLLIEFGLFELEFESTVLMFKDVSAKWDVVYKEDELFK